MRYSTVVPLMACLLASVPAHADIKECVGPNGKTAYTNFDCPAGFSLKSAVPESGGGPAQGTLSPATAVPSSSQDIPPEVMARIRSRIESAFPGNSSIEFLVKNEMEAYTFLASYSPPRIPTRVLHLLKEYFAAAYPEDYTTQKILLLREVERYRKADSAEREDMISWMQKYLKSGGQDRY